MVEVAGRRARLLHCIEDRMALVDVYDRVLLEGAAVVAIDAPLAPSPGGYRPVERAAMRLGARLLPPSLPGMRMLAARGLHLARLLDNIAVVVETHPRSVLRLCGGPLPVEGLGGCRGRDAHDAAVAAAAAALLKLGAALLLPGERYPFLLPVPGSCRTANTGERVDRAWDAA